MKAFLEQNVEVLDFSMQIYDRCGNLVFETDDYNQGWNGFFKSKLANSNVYVVYLDARIMACGREIRERLEGDVTLIR